MGLIQKSFEYLDSTMHAYSFVHSLHFGQQESREDSMKGHTSDSTMSR